MDRRPGGFQSGVECGENDEAGGNGERCADSGTNPRLTLNAWQKSATGWRRAESPELHELGQT
jgi:hypothetical protein